MCSRRAAARAGRRVSLRNESSQCQYRKMRVRTYMIYLYIHICIYISTHMYMYMNIYVYIFIHMYITSWITRLSAKRVVAMPIPKDAGEYNIYSRSLYIYVYRYVYVYLCIYVCVCVYTYLDDLSLGKARRLHADTQGCGLFVHPHLYTYMFICICIYRVNPRRCHSPRD